MVAIYVKGEDKTGRIVGWSIWKGQEGELMLTCHYASRKKTYHPLSECCIVPTEESQAKRFLKKGRRAPEAIDKAVIYGEKYAIIYYPGNPTPYVEHASNVEFLPESASEGSQAIFHYFTKVATARVRQAESGTDEKKRTATANVLRQLQGVVLQADTAFEAYCAGSVCQRESDGNFIYPFGINESQLQAVERAFTSQVSIVEGPPGTGKTQTILNIIANILLRGKTVAILSNNNAAVANVHEKLGAVGLDYLVAKLGNSQNRGNFFTDLPAAPTQPPSTPAPDMAHIQTVLQRLKQYLRAQNTAARLRAEVAELTVEREYLAQWQQENMVTAPISLAKYRLSPRKTADLMAYLNYLSEKRIRLKDRFELLLNFRIFNTKLLDSLEKRKSMVYALQTHYYDKSLQEKQLALAECRQELDHGNFKALLEDLTALSMVYLKHHLYVHVPREEIFVSTTYRHNFADFVRRYPVISSSTHSIVKSIKPGALVDYAIIDEASQQDIVPGVLALACARNLIIVGDRKQLPHIPAKLDIAAPFEFYDCDRYSLLDSCIGVFGDLVPATLLKEHYRCPPRIIQFCNQQYYDNQLIPMTQDAGEPVLQLIVTAKGNHTRNNSNLRELDSLLAQLPQEGGGVLDEQGSKGFITPYRAQVELSETHLPADYFKETVHKFQGRECNEIVFSTVLDKKRASQQKLKFVDDPYLVNVAVSRAKKKFTLVTGGDVFTKGKGHIAALIRYMEYYASEDQIRRAPVISAFDLLYKEYDLSLERLNARLKPGDSRYKSEQIVARILRDTSASVKVVGT